LDGGGRSKVLIAGLLMGIFLAAVDSTVVSVAMPTIASSLRGVEIYSWAFTAYILTSTVSGPLWGRISDVYGRKTIYLMGGVGLSRWKLSLRRCYGHVSAYRFQGRPGD
jgi:MFS family permease